MFDRSDQSQPGAYGPAQTAIVLLDFHEMFVRKIIPEAGPAALNVAAEMRTWAKSQGMMIIHGIIDVNATPYATCKGADRLAGIVSTMKNDGGANIPAELLTDSDEGDVTFVRVPGHVSFLKSPRIEEFLQ